jgi:polysaccharide export outer membrane protein
MILIRFFMVLALIGLGACHQGSMPLTRSGEMPPVASSQLVDSVVPEGMSGDLTAYRLGVNDVLDINVYQEADLSGQYKISSQGDISMPLIGNIKAAGMTVAELEDIIEAGYADGYLVSPSVTAQIEEYRPFYIMGEVRAPGQYAYADPLTVLNAVAMAGGFTYRAKQDVIRVRRDNQEIYNVVSPQSAVMPGDVIVVEERLF